MSEYYYDCNPLFKQPDIAKQLGIPKREVFEAIDYADKFHLITQARARQNAIDYKFAGFKQGSKSGFVTGFFWGLIIGGGFAAIIITGNIVR